MRKRYKWNGFDSITYQPNELGTHKDSNIVRLEMKDAMCPVNPLEDKFLLAFPKYIIN